MEEELEEIKELLQGIMNNQEKTISHCDTGNHTGTIRLPDTITTKYSIKLEGGFAEIQLSKYKKPKHDLSVASDTHHKNDAEKIIKINMEDFPFRTSKDF